MAAVPSYRQLAERTLDQTAQELNAMPQGTVSTHEIQARAAKGQVYALVAATQALLEIGDVLRENLKREGPQ